MSAILPPSMPDVSVTARSPADRLLQAEATEAARRSSPPPSTTGRWWFAFDRWLVVQEPNEDYVLA